MSLFSKLIRHIGTPKRKPPVYLGHVAAVPRSKIKQAFELSWDEFEPTTELRDFTRSVISLPLLESIEPVPDGAIRLDILISGYSFGSQIISVHSLAPIWWRPYVCVQCRLTRISDGVVIATYTTRRTASFRTYFARLFTSKRFTWGGWLTPVATADDLLRLLGEALIETLDWARGQV